MLYTVIVIESPSSGSQHMISETKTSQAVTGKKVETAMKRVHRVEIPRASACYRKFAIADGDESRRSNDESIG